jgi:uncharacterized membrane protein YGL010W
VAIPAIMLSIVGLLFAIHPWVAFAFVAASLVYYALLRAPAFLVTMLVLTALALALVHAMGEPRAAGHQPRSSWCAWIFQFVGHKIEGKKPSFFEDFQYLWVGPAVRAEQAVPESWASAGKRRPTGRLRPSTGSSHCGRLLMPTEPFA